MGSSIVMIWFGEWVLMWSTMAASVVDLPDPVGPVTRTSPRRAAAISRKTAGAARSSSDGTADGIVRNTAAQPRR